MKRLYTGCVLVALLSLAQAAYSVPCGFYVGAQAGLGFTNVPLIPEGDVTSDIYSAVAAAPGTTFGTGTGVSARINNLNVDSIILGGDFNTTVTDRVIGGRIFVGYQVFDLLAFELGYIHFRNANSSYTTSPFVETSGVISLFGIPAPSSVNFNAITRKDSYTTNIFDLDVKAIVPFCNSDFYIYGKIGAAYIKVKKNTDITLQNSSDVVIDGVPFPTAGPINLTSSSSIEASKVYPAIGLGAAYKVNNNIDIDLSWYRIVAKSDTTSNIDMLFFGVEYGFDGIFSDLI